MITSLRIENFALIDSTKIDFTSGFTVITGETGSGKSILLNALNLILGERANISVIGNHSDKSIVEAQINITGFAQEDFFDENDLDYFDRTIVRREINKHGRSRAFINDTPVQLSVLRSFASQLIHIHSQYNSLELKDSSFQLKLLDVLADIGSDRDTFCQNLTRYKEKLKKLKEQKIKRVEAADQFDYNTFQLSQLEELDLTGSDYDKIRSDVLKAENVDEIRLGFEEINGILSVEGGIMDQLNHLKSLIARKIGYDPQLKELYNRIESIIIELDDIEQASKNESEKIEFNPRELDALLVKIDQFNRALQKHGYNTQNELIDLMNELKEATLNLSELDAFIEEEEKIVARDHLLLISSAKKLHAKRIKAIPEIEIKIKESLNGLKLENTELIFSLTVDHEKLGPFGNSKLEILFSPNIGIKPVPIHLAASGGELSRVMLALQSLMSSKIQLRTILFDEIDTGVSGDVAQKMGATLSKMGTEMQVIAITHLPQVAAKGGQHLKVLKQVSGGTTLSSVIELNNAERVEETARLMSGDKINKAALENAKALMQ